MRGPKALIIGAIFTELSGQCFVVATDIKDSAIVLSTRYVMSSGIHALSYLGTYTTAFS